MPTTTQNDGRRTTDEDMAPMEIGYWAIRGLGAPARMMLAYAGDAVEYKDVRYTDPMEWFGKRKPELLAKNAMANLPYVVDGDRVVVHSNAVYEYLGMKTGVDAFENDDGRFDNAQACCEAYDLRNSLMDMVYPGKKSTRSMDEYKENIAPYLSSNVPTYYGKFQAWLEQRKTKFLVKDTVSSSDFHLWELIDQHEVIAKKEGLPSPLEAFPRLKTYYADFKALPQLQSYFTSDAHALAMNSAAGGAHVL